jgi:hypothetical protein
MSTDEAAIKQKRPLIESASAVWSASRRATTGASAGDLLNEYRK